MNNTKQATNGGIGFWGLLQIVLFALKVTGNLDWSWWAVLAPTIFGIAITMIVFVVIVLVGIARSR